MHKASWLPRFAPALIIATGIVGCAPPAAPDPTALPEAAAPVEPTIEAITQESPESSEAATHEVHWAYEGEAGPEHWAELDPENEACGSGMAQSPIDLSGFAEQDLANIVFQYQPSMATIWNNGHTVEVKPEDGGYIELDTVQYPLVQFHFHAPSEHTVGGVPAAAELHLVHEPIGGRRVVVGVLIQPGAENPAFETLWGLLPPVETEEPSAETELMAADMLPAVQTTFRYPGSLTTPPCTENVAWNVMTTPIEMSEAQLATLMDIIEGNNRPIQAMGDRQLLQDVSP